MTVTDAVLEALTLENTGANSLSSGDTTILEAMGQFSDGTEKNLTSEVAWKSSNKDVAVVQEGMLLALEPGNTSITANFGMSGVTSNAVGISVKSAEAISLNIMGSDLSETTPIGYETNLIAFAYYEDHVDDVSKVANWFTSDSNVVSIDNGHLFAKSQGTAEIWASFDGMLSDKLVIDVVDAKLESIFLVPEKNTLPLNSSIYVKAIGLFSDETHHDISRMVSWNGQNGNILVDGIFTAKEVGINKIYAQFNGIDSDMVDISVNESYLESMTFSVNSISVGLTDTAKVELLGHYVGDPTEHDVTSLAVWDYDSKFIEVSETGVITTKKTGFTKLKATIDDLNAEVGVFIHTDNIESIEFSIQPNREHIYIDKTVDGFGRANKGEVEVKIIGNYKNGTTTLLSLDNVSITQSNKDIVYLNEYDGDIVLEGHNEGDSIITVSLGELVDSLMVTVTSMTHIKGKHSASGAEMLFLSQARNTDLELIGFYRPKRVMNNKGAFEYAHLNSEDYVEYCDYLSEIRFLNKPLWLTYSSSASTGDDIPSSPFEMFGDMEQFGWFTSNDGGPMYMTDTNNIAINLRNGEYDESGNALQKIACFVCEGEACPQQKRE
ncbi:hypothetical protein HRJ45_15025 [Vibrio coralliilyticus]|nr:hypothetical protein [Vibrio coralliilyticus]NRF80425.1 hypothetical protein [Vibrio coralliilyticus]